MSIWYSNRTEYSFWDMWVKSNNFFEKLDRRVTTFYTFEQRMQNQTWSSELLHSGQTGEWSRLLSRHSLQNMWPQGVVTGLYSKLLTEKIHTAQLYTRKTHTTQVIHTLCRTRGHKVWWLGCTVNCQQRKHTAQLYTRKTHTTQVIHTLCTTRGHRAW